MIMKMAYRFLSLFFLSSVMLFADVGRGDGLGREDGYVPPEGFIPSELVAVQVAEAILIPIYGKEAIDRQKPLRAVLKDEVWTVTGTMKPGRKGGVALVEISKSDARILRVTHGK